MAVITTTTAASTSSSISSAAASTASTAATTFAGTVDFDFFSIDYGSIEFFNGGISALVVSHGYEGIPLLGDVNVGDLTTSGKFAFQDVPGALSVDSIYKKL